MSQVTLKIILTFLCLSNVSSHVLPIQRMKDPTFFKTNVQQKLLATNNSTTLLFGNVQDAIYFINLQVGTPPQTMGVQFDTGSNILWLPTQQSGAPSFYNTQKSSTFKNTSKPDSIQYADGSGVSGTYGTDILAISGTPISINATYLWVTVQSGMNFPNGIQGLVGMGYTTIPNFLDIAYQNNQISSPVFSLMIEDTTQQSYIFYNQIPQSITNSTYFVPVVGNDYWQVTTLGVTVGGIDMTSLAANTAIIDSGTSYFYVNQQLFENIINNFFQDCNNNADTPECPCSSTKNWPTFSFLFEGIQTYIYPQQYIGQTLTGCTYNFGTLSTVSQILLGDIFFSGYIITFDKPQSKIGFKGDLTLIDNVFSNNSIIWGYISMGIIGFCILIGLVAFCAIGKIYSSSDYWENSKIANDTGKPIEIAMTQRKRKRQPMLNYVF